MGQIGARQRFGRPVRPPLPGWLLGGAALFLGLGSVGGCGGKAVMDGTNGAGGTGTSTTTSGGQGTGAGQQGGAGGCAANSGDCNADHDCGTVAHCVALTPCGFRVCPEPVPEATHCSFPGADQCCTSADCTSGKCYASPSGASCGGMVPAPYNRCESDGCSSDSQCGSGSICAPAGTFGLAVKTCLPVGCKLDGDCQDEAGGTCAPVTPVCCSGPTGLYCVYPSDGCRSDNDCPGGYCSLTGSRASCQPGMATCPA